MSEDRVVVQLDMFPANATVMSTTFNNVRAVIADGMLQLYLLTASGIIKQYEKPSLGVEGSYGSGVAVTTADGTVWIEQAGGCGCGSQLKIADLFPMRQRVMIPLNS